MTAKELYEFIQDPKYDFLQTNPHLGDNILFLTVTGSRGYNVANEDSDTDIRGIAVNSCSDLLGLTNWDTFDDRVTDTTVFSLNKAVRCLMHGAPTLLELLYLPPENILSFNPQSQKLFENRDLFLSKDMGRAFMGYFHKATTLFYKAVEKNDQNTAIKSQYHQIRLLLEYCELLSTNTMTVYCTGEKRKKLLEVRNGEFFSAPSNDKLASTAIFTNTISQFFREIEELESKSNWPEHADLDKINELVMAINQTMI